MVQSPRQQYTVLLDVLSLKKTSITSSKISAIDFVAGGDYNAKHIEWDSRLITVRGKNLPQLSISNLLSISASIRLKTNEDIEAAAEYPNISIVNAIRSSTPMKSFYNKHEYRHHILKEIVEKRRHDKRKLNNGNNKKTH